METGIRVHGAFQPGKTTTLPDDGQRLVYVPTEIWTVNGHAITRDHDRYFSTTNPQDRSGTPCANKHTSITNLKCIKKTSAIVSCNRSITQPLAAIFQIIFAAKGLYDVRRTQVERYGYAAYSFTVIPYLLMSFLNLLAMICQPQYPTLYLVELNKPPGSQKEVAEAGDMEGGRDARTHDPQRGAPVEISPLSSQEKKPEGQSTDQLKAANGALGTIFLSRQRRSFSSERKDFGFESAVRYSVSPY